MSGEKGELYDHTDLEILREFNEYPYVGDPNSTLVASSMQQPRGGFGGCDQYFDEYLFPGSGGCYPSLSEYLASGQLDCDALIRMLGAPPSSSSAGPIGVHIDGSARVKNEMGGMGSGCVDPMMISDDLSAMLPAGGAAAPDSGGTVPVTPNSSLSSSSSEVGVEEELGRCKKDRVKQEDEFSKEQAKGEGEEEDKSKKPLKPRHKGEKRQKQPRFAFMTKSEVDHLEDGYRWRKYGQKAVKNSPFPRSYYRCTTQKCPVKKRVERSHHDSAVVITTYEGKHTHLTPATIRGSTHILAPPATAMSIAGFRRDLVMPPQVINQYPMLRDLRGGGGQIMQQLHHDHSSANPNIHFPVNLPADPAFDPFQFTDYGLLQDILPTSIHNNGQ